MAKPTTQTTTTPSAWSRLVQITKAASKNSRQGAPRRRAEPSESVATASALSAAMPQPNPTPESQQPSSSEASITVCQCLRGGSRLPGDKCSLSQSSQAKPAAKFPKKTPTTPATSNIRSRRGRRPKIQAVVEIAQEDASNLVVHAHDQANSTLAASQPEKEDSRSVTDEACVIDTTTDGKNNSEEQAAVASQNPPPAAISSDPQRDDCTGLRESDKGTINRNPRSPSSHSDNTTQPSSSRETPFDENCSPVAAPVRKAKRRLTLHGHHVSQQQQQQNNKKKRKIGTEKVQMTLSLSIASANGGMRECKVCDTVYNPLHAEDVKVHAKRHASVLKNRETVVNGR